MMQYNTVGKTEICLSVIGFGTAQLRMIPERQAIDTLCRGFELGVNWVHTATDYGGAEVIVSKAIRKFGRKDINVLSNAPGPIESYKWAFENTCRLLGTTRLPLFGISGIDYCEDLGHNIWGKDGLIEFLEKMKKVKRLDGIYCSTHGAPQYIEKLITSGCFDAIMLSYNPVGFHVLSYYGKSEGKEYEEIDKHESLIFPLAKEYNVSLLIMKPLAGGLLCHSKAFPPHEWFSNETQCLSAKDILQTILRHKEVCAVVPGTASIEEAEENALAGHAPVEISQESLEKVKYSVGQMRHSLCSRCGICEPTCSKHIPISWLFREGYMWNYPSHTFEALGRLHYFKLHPWEDLICNTCIDRTCICPSGLEIPSSLARVHKRMLILRKNKLLHPTPEELENSVIPGHLSAKIICCEKPHKLKPDQSGLVRLWLENTGASKWLSFQMNPDADNSVALVVQLNHRNIVHLPINHDIEPGQRVYFPFELHSPQSPGPHTLTLLLTTLTRSSTFLESTLLMSGTIYVEGKQFHYIFGSLKHLVRGIFNVLMKTSQWNKKILRKCNNLKRRVLSCWCNSVVDSQINSNPAPANTSYGVRYLQHNIPDSLPAISIYPAKITLENTGTMIWRTGTPDGPNVALYVRYGDRIVATHLLSRKDVHPGEHVTIRFAMALPSVTGATAIVFELVQFQVALFRDRGVAPLTINIVVEAPCADPQDKIWDIFLHHNPWHFQPTRGISRGADNKRYPVIAQRSDGCRLWDLAGHEYIDFIMGWGSTLLGYSNEKVKQAIIEAVKFTSPVIPYPHPLEMEVTQMLCEDFPCAEMAIFGKNGSDVCTLAVRVARVLTGKKIILYAGYHGWQDWWVEHAGFHQTGVPDRSTPLLHRFKFNDKDSFYRLYNQYRHDLAAVMLEPSGPLGEDAIGPDPGGNRNFLQILADAAHDANAFLIFDEIITGYRYPHGSVQKATGVTPDMTCIGKALASGMPLSALVGRTEILQEGIPKTRYAPTFKGEIYSFAAARAAINIYRNEPVAEYVWNYGLRLRQGINELCQQHGLVADCSGTPCRMLLSFQDNNPDRLILKKTLYYQELLLQRLCTYNGIMIPSYAHDEEILQRTLSIISKALQCVAEAESKDDFENRLEIPNLIDFQ